MSRHPVAIPLLSSRSLTRDFPGVRALDGVDFDLNPGEVHVLFGENGAGKSTFIAVLSGAIMPTSGAILMQGRIIKPTSVQEARGYGISAVFQEFSLIPELTVQENIFLGEEHRRGLFLDHATMHTRSKELLRQLGFDLNPERKTGSLTRAEQQMVEIVKAFRSQVSVLILDEPTASLTDHEARQLFTLIDTLKQRGVGIIYITHRMAEIRAIGDRITILRDGRKIATTGVADTTDESLIQMMTGRDVGAIFPEINLPPPGQEILKLDQMTTKNREVIDVSLTLNRGEIIGLAGLAGSGKSASMQAAFGLLPITSGRVIYHGEDITNMPPAKVIRRGMLYLPADRKHDGLMMRRSAAENMRLVALGQAPHRGAYFINFSAEKESAATLAERLNLSPRQPAKAVDNFSGGNQQKIMLARSIAQDFDLIVFNDPTVGVDVSTRSAIYRFIVDLAQAGGTIVIISSDLMEILHLTSRAFVFCRGHIQAELTGDAMVEENFLAHFFESEKECA